MKNTDYYDRMAKDLYERAYSDGYSDGLHKGRAYSDGYSDGLHKGKEKYGQHLRGIAHCTRATKEQIDSWGKELWGWCDCGKSIEGRWVGLANFCPWCGRVMEWEGKDNE